MIRPGLLKYEHNLRILRSLRLDSLSQSLHRDDESIKYISKNCGSHFKGPDFRTIFKTSELVLTLGVGTWIISVNKSTGDIEILKNGKFYYTILDNNEKGIKIRAIINGNKKYNKELLSRLI